MNHVQEYDTIFHDLCPVCLHKIIFVTGLNPRARYVALKDCMDELIDEYGPEFAAAFGPWSDFYHNRIKVIDQTRGQKPTTDDLELALP